MTAASRSLATAPWGARFASGLLLCYTTSRDTTREAWFEDQLDLDPTRTVFIDETSANTKMARLYGRAPRGERCRAAVPHGHCRTNALRSP